MHRYRLEIGRDRDTLWVYDRDPTAEEIEGHHKRGEHAAVGPSWCEALANVERVLGPIEVVGLRTQSALPDQPPPLQ